MGIPFVGNPFATPQTEYPAPIPYPPCDPDFVPVNVPISCYWLPFVAGACKALLQEAAFADPGSLANQVAIERAQNLLAIFETAMQSGACSGLGVAFSCSYDLPTGAAGWAARDEGPTFTPEFISVFTGGQGFTSIPFTTTLVPLRTFVWSECELNFTATPITSVSMHYDLVKGDFDVDDGNQTGIILFNAGSVVATALVHSAADPDGSNTITFTGPVTADKILMRVECANLIGSTGQGSATITSSVVSGTGTTIC